LWLLLRVGLRLRLRWLLLLSDRWLSSFALLLLLLLLLLVGFLYRWRSLLRRLGVWDRAVRVEDRLLMLCSAAVEGANNNLLLAPPPRWLVLRLCVLPWLVPSKPWESLLRLPRRGAAEDEAGLR
jgi:hypothetical protein